MNKDGMARVNAALEKLNARDADATMPSDLDSILEDIELTIGLDAFNERVRGALLAEYKRISGAGLR